ncbi:MAG: response regulator [Cyanobacteria bacterium J06598_3]
MKILVVDDDTALTQLISNRLKQDNYVVEVAPNGEYAIDLLDATPCSLVILDIVLPSISGIEVCQILRDRGNRTPILMLTGKDHTQDKVTGLDAGADDYLVKPFELNELTARVRALLRRNTQESTAVLSYGDLHFDPSDQTLMYQGTALNLRPKELAILELLMRYPSRIFSPEAFLDQLWNLAEYPSKDTIKTHIRSLRKQLASKGASNLIETLYGRGYRLNPAFLKPAAAEKGDRPKAKKEAIPAVQPVSAATARNQATCDNQDQTVIEKTVMEKTVIEKTWQQVQTMSWQRLVRLQALVRSLYLQATTDAPPQPHFETPPAPSQPFPPSWQETSHQAMTIAHQLKGNLGSFGFHAASAQAQAIEDQLQEFETYQLPAHDLTIETTVALKPAVKPAIETLVRDVEQLTQLLQIHIDDHVVESHSLKPLAEKKAVGKRAAGKRAAGKKAAGKKALSARAANSLLVVSRDRHWSTQLQSQQQTAQESNFTLHLCTPGDISSHLLHHTPTAILLEISGQHLPLDLGLLGVLTNNYSTQVPLLGLIDEQHYTQYSQQALQKGANATISKGWAVSTVLAITAEYL